MEKSKKTSKKQNSSTDDLQSCNSPQNCMNQMSNSLTNSSSNPSKQRTSKTSSENHSSH